MKNLKFYEGHAQNIKKKNSKNYVIEKKFGFILRGGKYIPGGVNSPVRAFKSVGGVLYFK